MSEFKFIKNTIYELKKQYPTEIIIKISGSPALDLTTGEVLSPFVEYSIYRAIVLPKKTRLAILTALNIKNAIAETTRQVLIDATDLPANIELKKEDTKIIYNNETWDISSIDLIENLIYDIRLKEIEGSLT